MFEFYWNSIGLWFSRTKGQFVDSSSFLFTESLIWVGILVLLWFFRRSWVHLKRFFYPGSHTMKGPNKLWTILSFVFGPLLLMLLITGQGAAPIAPFPTFLRDSPAKIDSSFRVQEKDLKAAVNKWKTFLDSNLNSETYREYDEVHLLNECNSLLNKILLQLKSPPGRDLKRVKAQKGLTRIFGLSYGGPGYHDPLTGEVAIAAFEDYPTAKY